MGKIKHFNFFLQKICCHPESGCHVRSYFREREKPGNEVVLLSVETCEVHKSNLLYIVRTM